MKPHSAGRLTAAEEAPSAMRGPLLCVVPVLSRH